MLQGIIFIVLGWVLMAELLFVGSLIVSDRSIELPETGEYFFPDAATADEPEEVATLLEQDKRLQIRFDLPYLPLGFHTRLVKPLFKQTVGIQYSDHIWRQGFIMQQADSHAVVQYLLRKSSIEVTLCGQPEHYATLLEHFYHALKGAVAESKSTFNIRPFVFLEKGLFELGGRSEAQAFSVHSITELIKVLQAATSDNLAQIHEGIRAMAANKQEIRYGDTYEMKGGDGAVFAPKSKKTTITTHVDKSNTTITAHQRKVISNVLDAMLDHPEIDKIQTKQIVRVQDVIEAEPLELDEEKQSKLNLAYQEVKSLIGATNDGIGVATAVSQNWPAITAWFSGLAAIMGMQ